MNCKYFVNLIPFYERLITKNKDGTIENILLRDDSMPMSSTTIAKRGYLNKNKIKNTLVLFEGVIQKEKENGQINFINFDRTEINLSDFSTKTTTFQKVQEISSLQLMRCIFYKKRNKNNFFWETFVVQKYQNNMKELKIIERDCEPYHVIDIINEK